VQAEPAHENILMDSEVMPVITIHFTVKHTHNML